MRNLALSLWILLFLVAANAALGPSSARAYGSESEEKWQTYRPQGYGIEVQLPPNWRVTETKGTMKSFLIGQVNRQPNGPQPVQFILQPNQNPKKLPIDKWFENQLHSEKAHGAKSAVPQYGNTKLGQSAAVRMVTQSKIGRTYNYYVALKTGDVLTVSIMRDRDSDGLDDMQYKILARVKIL